MQTRSIDELLAAYQQGDGAAFQEFFRRSRPLVFGFLMARLRHREAAEEAFQETYLRIHRHILTYRRELGGMGWVMTIAGHAATDMFRRHRMPAPSDLTEALHPAAPESSGQAAAEAVLHDLLTTLPEPEQTMLRERFLDDLSYTAMARRHGTTEANVRQRLSRLIRRLRVHAGKTSS